MSWYEDDDFWRAAAPAMFPERQWALAPTQITQVLALTGTAEGAAVLDLPCGPGRHSLELARRGYSVTGVDLTERYLGELRRAAAGESLALEVVHADMRDFVRAASFDLAINLFSSFGYFEDPEDDLEVLRNFNASLRPGGSLVLELLGREVLSRIYRPRDWSRLEDDGLVLEERFVAPDWSCVDSTWILIQGTRRETFNIKLRLYGAADLSALLRAAGFDDVSVWGGLDGSPYDHTAKRMALVARKA